MPNAFNITPAPAPDTMTRRLLELGCNVWDGVGLPGEVVTSNATLLPFIHYPRSIYNSSVACRGFRSDSRSLTLSREQIAPHQESIVPSASVLTAMHSTNSAVYASLWVSTGGAVTSLQRGAAALRLAAQCLRSTRDVDTEVIAANSSYANEPMSYDLSENPLQLLLPWRRLFAICRGGFCWQRGACLRHWCRVALDRNVTATLRQQCCSPSFAVLSLCRVGIDAALVTATGVASHPVRNARPTCDICGAGVERSTHPPVCCLWRRDAPILLAGVSDFVCLLGVGWS